MDKAGRNKDIRVKAKRQRRRQRDVCGIYFIRHVRTGKTYVGQAAEVRRRWGVHRFWLRNGQHHCVYLQRLWDKYGESAFEFVLAELCTASLLNRRETYWYGRFKRAKKLINIHPPGKNPRGFRMSVVTRAKMSASAKIVSNTPAARRERSKRAKLQHKTGRIGYREKTVKYRRCANCKNRFEVPRRSSGHFSGTVWCDGCRPPHVGGYYKTAQKLKVGTQKHYRELGPPYGWKHTKAARILIGVASKRYWARRRKLNRE